MSKQATKESPARTSISLKGGFCLLFLSSIPVWAAGPAPEPTGLSSQEPSQQKPAPEERKPTYYDGFSQRTAPEHAGAPQAVDTDAAPRVEWTNPQGGAWKEADNWSGGAVPGEGDHAVIDLPGSYTVHLEGDTRITGLTLGGGGGSPTLRLPSDALALRGPAVVGSGAVLALDGGRITGDGDVLVDGTLLWSGGAMSGRGKLRVSEAGRLELSGTERKVLSLRHLENAGTVVWQGEGSLVVTYGAQLVNQAKARFEVAGGAFLDVYGAAGPAVHNAGTLVVGPGGLATFEAPLVNSGVLELESPLRQIADYSQTAEGELRIHRTEPAAGGGSAALRIAGQATLAGTFRLLGSPPEGQPPALEVLTFESRDGDFSAWEGLSASGGRRLEPKYGDGVLSLQ